MTKRMKTTLMIGNSEPIEGQIHDCRPLVHMVATADGSPTVQKPGDEASKNLHSTTACSGSTKNALRNLPRTTIKYARWPGSSNSQTSQSYAVVCSTALNVIRPLLRVFFIALNPLPFDMASKRYSFAIWSLLVCPSVARNLRRGEFAGFRSPARFAEDAPLQVTDNVLPLRRVPSTTSLAAARSRFNDPLGASRLQVCHT